MTKTQLMELVEQGRCRESFEHTIFGTFDITAMRAAAVEIAEEVEVPLYSILDFIKEKLVTEESRILDLTRASWETDPGICFTSPDGAVMIDGHHRALRRDREGKTHMKMWLFPAEVLSAFRPLPGWGKTGQHEWGDPIVNGKIIRGGK